MANLDEEVLSKLEKLGYPSKFVRESLQKKELTDACTVYWLVHGMKLQAQKQLELQKLKKNRRKLPQHADGEHGQH